LVESVNKSHIPELYAWIQEIGGYFKRFKGGALAPWISNPEDAPPLDLEARMTQAFFEVSLVVDNSEWYAHIFRLINTCPRTAWHRVAVPPLLLPFSIR
jgi:hypothetical protein